MSTRKLSYVILVNSFEYFELFTSRLLIGSEYMLLTILDCVHVN